MSLDSLEKLFLEELRDIYNAEKQLTRALPRMAKAAESPELRQAFTTHLKETEGQIQRLERVFKEVGQAVRGKKCKGMEGLIAEGKELLEEDAEEDVLDAGLIASAQHIEHYEIAGYGCVRTYAQLLGLDNAAKLLQQTLDEEKETDELLSGLAENINVEAEEEEAA
jgi:ferritin-like metal-binding protein YciE